MSKKKQDTAKSSSSKTEEYSKWQKIAEQEAEQDAEPAPEEKMSSSTDEPVPVTESATVEALTQPSRTEFENQLTAKEKEVDVLKKQYLEAKAEADNVRKRTEKQISDAYKFSTEKLLNDLLPVIDSLVRGLEGAGDQADDPVLSSVREGIQLTLEMFEKVLEKHGVQGINPAVGEVFDPKLQEAVVAQPEPGAESNTVLKVLQKGYQLNGRVVRAAMVIVAK